MEKPRKHHCWECLRRCLVCDSTRPACRRCLASGTACPGYGDVKPPRIRWLAPGKVTSRRKKRTCTGQDSESMTGAAEIVRTAAVLSFSGLGAEHLVLGEAAEYFNTCIYQDLAATLALGPNPAIYMISPTHVRVGATLPDHLRLGLVCMTLSHRINRTSSPAPERHALIESFFRYRGLVIRSLGEDIALEQKRMGDIVVAGIISLLLADAQQGASRNWRCHLEAIRTLIVLRGGLRSATRTRSLRSLLLCFITLSVIGNTTTPASDLIMTKALLDDVGFIVNEYDGSIGPFQMCPPPLFAEIIKITHLRFLGATTGMRRITTGENLPEEADEILSRIEEFSPQEWANSRPSSQDDWNLLASTYKVSVKLYFIASLQSASILPADSYLKSRRDGLDQLLRRLLGGAVLSTPIRIFVLWPLIVLGVEAASGSLETQGFVEKQLPEISWRLGSYAPLTALSMLQKFWASGKTQWDECFEHPYVFATQLAVDLSQTIPFS